MGGAGVDAGYGTVAIATAVDGDMDTAVGVYGEARTAGARSGTIGQAFGVLVQVRALVGTADIDTAYGGRFVAIGPTDALLMQHVYGLTADATGGARVTGVRAVADGTGGQDAYAVYASAADAAVNNYALYTERGDVRLGDLAGTGDRMVVADADGVLATQALPAAAAPEWAHDGAGGIDAARAAAAGRVARFDAAGRLRIGHATARNFYANANSAVYAESSQTGTGPSFSANPYGIDVYRANDAVTQPVLNFGKSRGTLDAPAPAQAQDKTGRINFTAYDGSGYVENATITAWVPGTGAVAAGDAAGELFFATRAWGDTKARTRMSVSAEGRVGIGLTNPATALDVNGQITSSGTVVTSDSTLKTAVTPISDALAIVAGLNGVYYDWTAEARATRELSVDRQVGFLAQAVERVLPEAVQSIGDGKLGVDYGKVTPVLAKAIQEQQGQIEALRERNEALSSEVDELKSLVRELLDDRTGDSAGRR